MKRGSPWYSHLDRPTKKSKQFSFSNTPETESGQGIYFAIYSFQQSEASGDKKQVAVEVSDETQKERDEALEARESQLREREKELQELAEEERLATMEGKLKCF